MPSRHRNYNLSSLPATGRCLVCNGPLPKRAHKYCSREHAAEMLARYDYTAMTAAVLKRDGHKCIMCGSTRRLEVDHIVPISDRGSVLDQDNCRTLCHQHHVEVTAEWRRSKADERRHKKLEGAQRKYIQPWPRAPTSTSVPTHSPGSSLGQGTTVPSVFTYSRKR